MKTKEIFRRIEEILSHEVKNTSSQEVDTENNSTQNRFKEVGFLTLQIFLNILKAPFNIIAKYLRDEILNTIKKDAKIFALIFGIMIVLFVFFSVIWLFISFAVGLYFYENGYSLFISIIFSIIFQIISFILIALSALFASKKIKTVKVLKQLSDPIK